MATNSSSTFKRKPSLLRFIFKRIPKNLLFVLVVMTVSLGIVVLLGFSQCFNKVNIMRLVVPTVENKTITIIETKHKKKTYFLHGANRYSDTLAVLYEVLERIGYEYQPNNTGWDLLWSYPCPFKDLQELLRTVKPHQRINHFPGNAAIVNKINLATSGLKYIPKAFKFPEQKNDFITYADKHQNVQFVQKGNDHRGIRIRSLGEIDFDDNSTFYQEFVENPFLVNGHKFDIGVYTIITSIDPLRVYIYNGEAGLRFCPQKYYPFDAENTEKYVIEDAYLPLWDVPEISEYYSKLGFSMKESLNAHLRKKGKDPSVIWEQIEDAIRIVFLCKEELILEVARSYPSTRNFFEMMRFDFVVNADLEVFLMEANMSPNLSAGAFPENRNLFERVLYNLFGLVGISERIDRDSLKKRSQEEEDMIAMDRNIAVFPKECNSNLCVKNCSSPICQLCKTCLTSERRRYLLTAFREHMDKGDCKRIYPPIMVIIRYL